MMLRCVVHVNTPACKLSDSFRTQLATMVAKRYDLQTENIIVLIREGLRLMRAGTKDACGYIELFGCDAIFDDAEKNREDTTALIQLLQKESGIPLARYVPSLLTTSFLHSILVNIATT
ncbi:uncharacterized protein LOC115929372 [Strongylocentrotus purpuratus]|uniref:Uncharacterized protein n=1 Tax=Strongylocentrotus purpuratus TaxID=7668 RepID=A0A7M7PMW8_STRPU|nr:uncharacterized protein LOC115929372 [Strongylocentrotus purpuratus]